MEDSRTQKNLMIGMTPEERLDVYKAVIAIVPFAQYFSPGQFQLFIAEMILNVAEDKTKEWLLSFEGENYLYLIPIPLSPQ